MPKTTVFFTRIAKPENPSDKQYHTGTGDPSEEIWFTPAEVDETAENELREEIRKWELIDTYHNKYEDQILDFCINSKNIHEICEYLHITSKTYVREKILKPLINKGKLEYTNKNSINAKNQRYIKVVKEEKGE